MICILGFIAFISLYPLFSLSINNFYNSGIIHDYFVPYDYELCIATRIKDVPKLVPQWIEFHLVAGVGHIYIVNDCSRESSFFWPVDFYSDDVTFIMNNTALNCSNHDNMGVKEDTANVNLAFQTAKKHCQWVAVIDPDEYIFPSDDNANYVMNNNNDNDLLSSSSISGSSVLYQNHHYHKNDQVLSALDVPPLLSYLRNTSVLPVIRMPWYTFSTNGLEKAPKGELIVNTYTHGRFETIMKSIAKSKYVVQWMDSHKPTKFEVFGSPKIEGKHLRDYTRSWNIQPHEMTISDHSHHHQCTVPKATFYLRHFRVLAWEDHVNLRLSYKVGIFREFSQDSEDNERLKWEEMNFQQIRDP